MLTILVGMIASGCASKKKMVRTEPEPVVVEQPQPSWHTTVVNAADATISAAKQSINATCQMLVVRDSMLVISVMPLFGIEMLRVEATPTEVKVIDKMGRRFAIADYTYINQLVTPELTWQTLQDIASGEQVTNERDWYTFTYSAMGYTANLKLRYNTIKHDGPMRVTQLNTTRYTQIDPKSFLK